MNKTNRKIGFNVQIEFDEWELAKSTARSHGEIYRVGLRVLAGLINVEEQDLRIKLENVEVKIQELKAFKSLLNNEQKKIRELREAKQKEKNERVVKEWEE